MIVVDRVTKRFGTALVLDAVSVTFERGKVTALVGPSGCGKSTLLRCINGLERFDEGSIRVGELAVTAAPAALLRVRREVGMVFQHYGLFSHMSAISNVMEGPIHVLGHRPEQARAAALALLEKVGLAHRRDAFPRELSGGEQQRVAIARALAMGPKALLLDEPTAALDPARKVEVVEVLAALAEAGTTMIIVTHEPAVLEKIADRVLTLRNGAMVTLSSSSMLDGT